MPYSTNHFVFLNGADAPLDCVFHDAVRLESAFKKRVFTHAPGSFRTQGDTRIFSDSRSFAWGMRAGAYTLEVGLSLALGGGGLGMGDMDDA